MIRKLANSIQYKNQNFSAFPFCRDILCTAIGKANVQHVHHSGGLYTCNTRCSLKKGIKRINQDAMQTEEKERYKNRPSLTAFAGM